MSLYRCKYLSAMPFDKNEAEDVLGQPACPAGCGSTKTHMWNHKLKPGQDYPNNRKDPKWVAECEKDCPVCACTWGLKKEAELSRSEKLDEARFYASIQGHRGEVTRLGHKNIYGHIRGWDTGAKVYVDSCPSCGEDRVTVYKTGGSSSSSYGNEIIGWCGQNDGYCKDAPPAPPEPPEPPDGPTPKRRSGVDEIIMAPTGAAASLPQAALGQRPSDAYKRGRKGMKLKKLQLESRGRLAHEIGLYNSIGNTLQKAAIKSATDRILNYRKDIQKLRKEHYKKMAKNESAHPTIDQHFNTVFHSRAQSAISLRHASEARKEGNVKRAKMNVRMSKGYRKGASPLPENSTPKLKIKKPTADIHVSIDSDNKSYGEPHRGLDKPKLPKIKLIRLRESGQTICVCSHDREKHSKHQCKECPPKSAFHSYAADQQVDPMPFMLTNVMYRKAHKIKTPVGQRTKMDADVYDDN